jgi:hypothetical protein
MQLQTLLTGLALTLYFGWVDEPKRAADDPPTAPAATRDRMSAVALEKMKVDANAAAARSARARSAIQKVPAIGGAIQKEAAPVADMDADPALQQIMQQWLPQFRALVTSELNFIHTVCDPTPEQYRTFKGAGDASLQFAAKKFAEVQKRMQQGVRPGQQPQWPDPRKLIAERLAQSVQQTLSAEQANRYAVELERRAAARKRAAVTNMVVKIDRHVVLTTEQRNKLTESLDANWNDSWVSQLEVFMYGDQFLPVVPDDQVLPFLNEKQKEIWTVTARNQNGILGWVGFGFVQPVEVDVAAEPAAPVENGAGGKEDKP